MPTPSPPGAPRRIVLTPASPAPAVRELHMDRHVVAVNKPAGLATHAPAPDRPGLVEALEALVGEGLGVHHRLDAGTSGVLVFSRSPEARAALARQFEGREVRKHYLALVAGRLPQPRGALVDRLVPGRGGRRAEVVDPAAPTPPGAKRAETRYALLRELGPFALYEARPVTGRTHQIRAQLAAAGAPILGDLLYGGGLGGGRLMLHAAALELELPELGAVRFEAAPPPSLDPEATSLDRVLDEVVAALAEAARALGPVARLGTPAQLGLPALKPDRYGEWLALRLYECDPPAGWTHTTLEALAERLCAALPVRGVYLKTHQTHRAHRPRGHAPAAPRRATVEPEAPAPDTPLAGVPAPDAGFVVDEDGVRYSASMTDGLGCRLYLDQRENRRWVREHCADGASLLNLFAYTCSFTAAAALGGARTTTSVDISTKSLEIGRENLRLNEILGPEPDERHRFLARDALAMLERAASRGEAWDLVVCDPPSFARRGKRTFQIERELDALTRSCLAVVAPGGWLLLCVNHRAVRLADVRAATERAALALGRRIEALELLVSEDGLGPLGVGTDLKTLRVQLGKRPRT